MPASTHRSAPHLATLVLLSGLSVISLNLFLPSLPGMATDFGVGYGLVSLAVTGYAAVTAVLQTVMGPLSDRYGRRPVMLAALLLFTLASLGCVLSTDIATFLVFRALQGAIITGHAVSLAVIRDTAGARRAASLIGYLASAWAVAPMLAPLVGGLLDTGFGWRASFWLFTLCGAAVLLLCWIDLGETNANTTRSAGRPGQGYRTLLRSRPFWGYAVCMAFSTGAFYAFITGAPLLAEAVFGLPPLLVGIAIGSITGGFVAGSFLAGRYAERHPLVTMMIAGRIVACAGLSLGLVLVALGVQHPMVVFGACMAVGLGNGVTMPSSNAGVMSVRPDLAGSAAGLAGALTVGSGALMAGVTGLVVTAANAVWALPAVMLLASLIGLAGALAVRSADRAAARPAPASD